MPDSQFPSGEPQSLRIAPHLSLDQTKLTSTEDHAAESPVESFEDESLNSVLAAGAMPPTAGAAAGPPSEPVRLVADRAATRSYRTVLFLALAAALLVNLLVRDARNAERQQASRDAPKAVVGSGLLDPR